MKKLLSFLLLSLGILGLAISEEIPSDGTAVWEYTPISGSECLPYYQISDDNNTCYFATWLLPSNAYASGYSWKCNDPYKKERYGDSDYSYRCSKPETASYASSDPSIPPNGYTLVCDTNPCRRVKIPDNAYASRNNRGWSCKSEYKLSGNSCRKNLYIPPNAYASNDGWTCLSGYKQSGKKCIKDNESNKSKEKIEPQTKVAETKKVVDEEKVYSAASGSGFAVTSDGYVITNYHVIKGCTDVYIHDKGESILSTIVTFDPNNDIALLKGKFKPRRFYPLSRESTKLLTEVYVAGHPFGRDISTSVKVTRGIVSSLTGVANNFSNLQIDASLQPGNSGGPIINDKGNVIGVAVAKLDLDSIIEEYGVVPENVNFGVKADVVINILEGENIMLPNPNKEVMLTNELGELITEATYYISCRLDDQAI